MQKLVVLTGAGMSAESGIQTFRDSGGLWEGYDVIEVASPQGWAQDPEKVLDFYNARKQNALDASPNKGHLLLADLERHYQVDIVTQNIDNLHERAGSTKVLHLHGEITKCRSTLNEHYVVENLEAIKIGDLCPKGGQLRPHIVWFGEEVPNLSIASEIVSKADILLIVGTSMDVYPAAGLLHYAPLSCKTYLIDPNPNHKSAYMLTHIVQVASRGVEIFIEQISKKL